MKYFYITLFFVSLWLTIQCNNPFATREPEPPTGDRSSWQQPTTPEIVVENLKLAIIEGNLANYMKCLVDTNSRFKFIPDELVRVNNPGVFEYWGLSSEQEYISKVFSATTDSSKMALMNPTQVPDYQDSVFLKIEYELELHHNLDESFPKSAKGEAEFWLNRSSGQYYITQWTDFGTANTPSWSSIKASFGK